MREVSGSIRRGRRAGTWEVRVSLGRDPLTGKYHQVSRTVTGTRRDARAALAELTLEVAHETHVAGASDATVAQLLAEWLDLVQDRLSPTTMRNYRGMCAGTSPMGSARNASPT